MAPRLRGTIPRTTPKHSRRRTRWPAAIVDVSVPLAERHRLRLTRSRAEDYLCRPQAERGGGVHLSPGLTPADLPDGEGWGHERIDISTHNGTHLDAPYHFASTMDGGKPRCASTRVVFAAGREARLPPLPGRLRGDRGRCRSGIEAHGHQLAPLEIVVVNPRVRYGETDMCPRAAAWRQGGDALSHLARRVRVAGRDTWSWDAPLCITPQEIRETRNARLIWEGHRAGREIGCCSHREAAQPGGAAHVRGFTAAASR